MKQGNLKRDEFDLKIVLNENEMEVSFPAFVEIDRAVDRAIEIARQFETKLVLVFRGLKISINKDSRFKDVMEKYIFG